MAQPLPPINSGRKLLIGLEVLNKCHESMEVLAEHDEIFIHTTPAMAVMLQSDGNILEDNGFRFDEDLSYWRFTT